LHQCDLGAIHAEGLSLRHTQLVDCMMAGTRLPGTRWRDVHVEGSDTSWLDLTRAVLLGVRFSNSRLGGASLTRARLQGAFLAECDLRCANLYAADLRGAVLVRCDLSDAHAAEADLRGTVMIECCLDRADLGGAIRG
jgi:uncharacterized protein YjbI with pentapeptide repeats